MLKVLAMTALLAAWLLAAPPVRALELEFKGRLTGWAGADSESREGLRAGLRYLPTLSLRQDLGQGRALDVEASLNAWAALETGSFDRVETEAEAEPYRLWARFSTEQLELRAGLQKINFGPARLLRALRWFDQLDPRDPLGLTKGVWGLLGRYYFLNNANIWLWALHGNDETKGWETLPTLDGSVELGGRVQIPLLQGEVGLSYHHRRADLGQFALPGLPGSSAENRIGLDGRWDVGVGLWFEAVGLRREEELGPLRHEKYLNLGSDYTLDLGNGLGIALEHLILDFSEEFFDSGQTRNLTALSLSYSLGMYDTLGTILYRDWENKDNYLQLSWQKLFDNWSFHLLGFANPEQTGGAGLTGLGGSDSVAPGLGVMVIISFNH